MFKADEGKVWKSRKEGWVGSETLILANNDNLANYEQVDKPVEGQEELMNQNEEFID